MTQDPMDETTRPPDYKPAESYVDRSMILAEGSNKRLCGAKNAQGEPCRKTCAPGFYRCHLHGAASPQAKRTARQRLLATADRAVEALETALDTDKCPTCGRTPDMSVVVRAAQIVLDRTGHHPTLAIAREEPRPVEWPKYLLPEQRTQIIRWMAAAQEREAAGADETPGLIEGELVNAGLIDAEVVGRDEGEV